MGSENHEHNYYQVLGVEIDAQDPELDEAYEARLIACDEISNDPELDGLTHEDVRKIRELLIQAYKTLRDPAKRASYNKSFFGESPATEISNTNADLSPNYETTDNYISSESIPMVRGNEYNTVYDEEPLDIIDPKEASADNSQERSRRFTEFPSFPNMMEAQQAVSNVIPQGRLKKTTSLPAEAVEELTQSVRDELSSSQDYSTPMSQIDPIPSSSIDDLNQEVESRLDSLANRFKTKSASSESSAAAAGKKTGKTQSSQEQPYVRAQHNVATRSASRPSLEMRRSFTTNSRPSNGKALDFILMFCAFILPLATIIFVLVYFLLK